MLCTSMPPGPSWKIVSAVWMIGPMWHLIPTSSRAFRAAVSRSISRFSTRPPGTHHWPRAGASLRFTSSTLPQSTIATSTQAMGIASRNF
jgi:hypothetical protein